MPTEEQSKESGAGFLIALDKKSLKLRPRPEEHVEKAYRLHIVTALASRVLVGQSVIQGEMTFLPFLTLFLSR